VPAGGLASAAYTLAGATSGTAPAVNPGAQIYIPTEDQWHKAAYYKVGSTNAGYWGYATQRETAYEDDGGLGFRLAAVPEPSTFCMALAGLACGGYLVCQRKHTSSGKDCS
jgi:hypothetical protein